MKIYHFGVLAVFLAAPARVRADATSCQNLASIAIAPPADAASLSIDATSFIAGTNSLPEYCQVNAHLDSEINFLLKLPTTWNHKILMSGNGGLGGSFDSLIPGLDDGLAKGYAVTGTDTGHNGDPSVLLNRPDRIANFQYRSVHLVALAAKQIVHIYYGAAAKHSYFSSCSNGGRQGMLEAQAYPEDFDGVVAGAPVLSNGGFQIWNSRAMFPDGPASGVLPQQKVTLLSSLVLRKCDALDGVVDGLVEDPRRCNFSPEKDLPRCPKDVDGTDCFTRAQVEALQQIHEGPESRGHSLGAEYFFSGGESFDYAIEGDFTGSLDFSWNVSGFPGVPALYPDDWGIGLPSQNYWAGTNYLRYIVFSDPAYLLQTFDYHNRSDVSRYTNALAPQFPASPDFSAFARRGGKLIEWQGWSDSVANPAVTVQFYQAGARALGGLEHLMAFDRLFLVPGTLHCGDGWGPWNFDPLPALEKWVENGKAPDSMIGSNPYTGISRPVCAYPEVAKLINPSLDPTMASSFRCAKDNHSSDR